MAWRMIPTTTNLISRWWYCFTAPSPSSVASRRGNKAAQVNIRSTPR